MPSTEAQRSSARSRGREPVDARAHDGVDGVGQLGPCLRCLRPLDELLQEERVAARPADDRRDRGVVEPVAGRGADELGRLVVVQRLEQDRHRRDRRRAGQRRRSHRRRPPGRSRSPTDASRSSRRGAGAASTRPRRSSGRPRAGRVSGTGGARAAAPRRRRAAAPGGKPAGGRRPPVSDSTSTSSGSASSGIQGTSSGRDLLDNARSAARVLARASRRARRHEPRSRSRKTKYGVARSYSSQRAPSRARSSAFARNSCSSRVLPRPASPTSSTHRPEAHAHRGERRGHHRDLALPADQRHRRAQSARVCRCALARSRRARPRRSARLIPFTSAARAHSVANCVAESSSSSAGARIWRGSRLRHQPRGERCGAAEDRVRPAERRADLAGKDAARG